MSYYLIYEPLFDHFSSKYPNKRIESNIGRCWHDSRYIQVSTPVDDKNVHYEYNRGYVCLHFENESLLKYRELINFLIESIDSDNLFEWDQDDGFIEIYYCQQIISLEQLDEVFETMVSLFDRLINEFFDKSSEQLTECSIIQNDLLKNNHETVDLKDQISKNY